METYSESAEGVLITPLRVRQELAAHGFSDSDSLAECLAECPAHGIAAAPMYDAGDVLRWLGY